MLFFVYLFLKSVEVVSQQSELCIFRCVASAAHFFNIQVYIVISPADTFSGLI